MAAAVVALVATPDPRAAGAIAAPAAGGVAAPASPSGQGMPVAAPPGWRVAFADDFSGSVLDGNFGAYSGQPGGDPAAWWSPSHVKVSGGMLHLATYLDSAGGSGARRWVSGGVGSRFAQTYGDYLVRMRMDAGARVAGVALLWPTVGWPPEVDFYEDGSAQNTRTWDRATLHYGSNLQVQHWLTGVDFTRWHTLGVEWTPGLLRYTIDGTVWATVAGPGVPATPMRLDLQTQVVSVANAAATPATVTMDVDWVVEYSPAGP